MEIRVHTPYQKILAIVKLLSSKQKVRLVKELSEVPVKPIEREALIELLLKGPVLSDAEIQQVSDNHQSIAEWRTKE